MFVARVCQWLSTSTLETIQRSRRERRKYGCLRAMGPKTLQSPMWETFPNCNEKAHGWLFSGEWSLKRVFIWHRERWRSARSKLGTLRCQRSQNCPKMLLFRVEPGRKVKFPRTLFCGHSPNFVCSILSEDYPPHIRVWLGFLAEIRPESQSLFRRPFRRGEEKSLHKKRDFWSRDSRVCVLLRSQTAQLKKSVSDERQSHNKTQLRLSRSESRLRTQNRRVNDQHQAHERLRKLFVSLVSYQVFLVFWENRHHVTKKFLKSCRFMHVSPSFWRAKNSTFWPMSAWLINIGDWIPVKAEFYSAFEVWVSISAVSKCLCCKYITTKPMQRTKQWAPKRAKGVVCMLLAVKNAPSARPLTPRKIRLPWKWDLC